MATIAHVSPSVAPPPEQRPAEQAEARGAPRIKCHYPAQLILYPPARYSHAIDVIIIDYSTTGIGITHHESLLIGQTYVVREPHATHNNTCLFTVLRSDPRPDGTWSIGLHISNTLADEFTPLCEEPPAPGIDIWTRLLFAIFALAGIAIIVLVEILRHRHH
jgi:hypothetical protein